MGKLDGKVALITGGGTGMITYGFKGGTGTSSRQVRWECSKSSKT